MFSPIVSAVSAARSHRQSPEPSAAKTLKTLTLGALAAGTGQAAAAILSTPTAPAPGPVAPVAPAACPALPLPCSCIATPPPVPTKPIGRDGVPDVFVTSPSAYLDEGVQVIVAQQPAGNNATSLFAFNCIDTLGDNALTSVSCVPQTLSINQTGLLSPIEALSFATNPQNGVGNGGNQVLLDYTVILKSIYDLPCTHSLLAQGLAYSLSDADVCGLIDGQPATFNNTSVVTHFQEALRDALNEVVPVVCYETSL